MPEFLIGSEDDWKNMLEEHPEFAVREEDSLLEEGALSRALVRTNQRSRSCLRARSTFRQV